MNYFFVDAETDGLYGPFLSVAVVVTDENGEKVDEFSASILVAKDSIKVDWVRENVFPFLERTEIRVADETALLALFWDFWMCHRENVICIADVPFPVETRLFSRCIGMDREQREFLGPYPLYDLATALLGAGIDPDTPRTTLAPLGLDAHDARGDVRMAAHIWHTYITPLIVRKST